MDTIRGSRGGIGNTYNWANLRKGKQAASEHGQIRGIRQRIQTNKEGLLFLSEESRETMQITEQITTYLVDIM